MTVKILFKFWREDRLIATSEANWFNVPRVGDYVDVGVVIGIVNKVIWTNDLITVECLS